MFSLPIICWPFDIWRKNSRFNWSKGKFYFLFFNKRTKLSIVSRKYILKLEVKRIKLNFRFNSNFSPVFQNFYFCPLSRPFHALFKISIFSGQDFLTSGGPIWTTLIPPPVYSRTPIDVMIYQSDLMIMSYGWTKSVNTREINIMYCPTNPC